MDPFFIWLEQSPLSTFIRETNSVFVFPGILVLHAVGMGLLVGTHVIVGFRVLGVARRVPLSALASFVPIGWAGLAANLFSGILLLIAYPTKALTNPLFYIKLSLILFALTVFLQLKAGVFPAASGTGSAEYKAQARDKKWAALLIILWLAAICAGRFLAYTYTRLTVFSSGGFQQVRGSQELIEDFEMWARATEWGAFARSSQWVWATNESIHFIGLSLLIGAVGLFDMRLMGMAKAIPVAALHRIIPIGIIGYLANAITGSLFFCAYPDQYMYNRAFQFKLVFMILAGINIAVFYSSAFRRTKLVGAGEDAPLNIRLIAGFSLFLWLAVLTCGRLLTFYRP